MCKFEFHYWKLGEFPENKAAYILNLMDKISKGFLTGNQQGKINFPFWKTEFGTHWEFYVYHRIFGFWNIWKTLLAKLSLKVKVYIAKLLSVYI